tara:strand:- start:371 stop:691 length:321 start_codon:yes stop_codon:yes gene_type:complete
MKKVLCGLIIALMMTGSGHSVPNRYMGKSVDTPPDCSFLKDRMDLHIELTNFYGTMKDELQKDYKDQELDINHPFFKEWEEVDDKEMKQIKKAHYFAVTWSARCND